MDRASGRSTEKTFRAFIRTHQHEISNTVPWHTVQQWHETESNGRNTVDCGDTSNHEHGGHKNFAWRVLPFWMKCKFIFNAQTREVLLRHYIKALLCKQNDHAILGSNNSDDMKTSLPDHLIRAWLSSIIQIYIYVSLRRHLSYSQTVLLDSARS